MVRPSIGSCSRPTRRSGLSSVGTAARTRQSAGRCAVPVTPIEPIANAVDRLDRIVTALGEISAQVPDVAVYVAVADDAMVFVQQMDQLTA